MDWKKHFIKSYVVSKNFTLKNCAGYQPSIGTPANCEKNGNLLKYQSYVRFIQSAEYDEDTYFDTLKETLLAKDVVKHGTWVGSNFDLQFLKQIHVLYNAKHHENMPI